MCEIKRVILNKKYIVLVLSLFAVNLAIFQYYQVDALSKINSEEHLGVFAGELLEKQRTQHDEFYRKLEEVPKQKEEMLEISIFSDEDSFSYKNIMKTAEDYERISDVELSDINDYAVDAFLEHGIMYVFGFIIMLFTVIAFLDERKKGLWQIIYTCREGRFRLILKRLFILFGVALVTETVLVTSTLSAGFIDYGGIDILFAPVQSVGKLQCFLMPVSLLTFLVYYVLFLSAALAVSGLFIWFILALIHNINLGMVVCSVVYVIEFFLNYMISSRNPLCILKYTNLWFFINPGEAFTKYTNFMAAGTMFNVREYLSAVLIILILLFSAAVLITGVKTRPFYTPGMVEKALNIAANRIRKIICHIGGMGFEIYKLLIQKKGIVVIICLLYLLVGNMDTLELLLGHDRMQLDAFYEAYTGEINDESLNAYNSIEEEINTLLNSGEEPGDGKLAMFEMLKEQKEYAQSLESRGIKGWFINDRGFDMLFGKLKAGKRLIDGVIVILAIVLLVAPCYASEYQSGVNYLIASTKKGRGIVFRRKTIYSLVCTLSITIIMFLIQFYEVRIKYNLNGLDAPVQNVRILEHVPFNISIGGFTLLWYMARAMTMIMVACVVMLISVYIRKQNKVYLVSFLLAPVGLLNGIAEYSSGPVVICAVIVPIVLSGLVSLYCSIKTYRKWSGQRPRTHLRSTTVRA